jgi:hypothetical protein
VASTTTSAAQRCFTTAGLHNAHPGDAVSIEIGREADDVMLVEDLYVGNFTYCATHAEFQ